MGTNARPVQTSIPTPNPNLSTPSFDFPESHHLVITTEKRVLSLDRDGLSNVFASSTHGILAAKEAKDGRGTLAIADSQVVVLHDLERGDRSYRLKGTEGQIRLLEYSPDCSRLFFTTTLLNAVQIYSLNERRLLAPGPTHPSPPTVLAISPSSHLLISCSEEPPIIYMQSLIHGTQPTRFQPWVSNAPVVRATFHKSRPTIFALAFKDGTIAAYDYTKLPRLLPVLTAERMQGQVRQPGEIGHFKHHHAVTTMGLVDPDGYLPAASLGGYDDGTKTVAASARSISVTGISFIPGFRARCMSVGADGKCKIVDFERLNTLKEWHVKGPATSLSVLSLKMLEEDGTDIIKSGRTVSQISLKAPTPNQKGGPDVCQIAIGRVDGKVLIYDMLGSLLRELTVDGRGGRVVDVDWVRGPKPLALDESRRVQLMDETSWIGLFDVHNDGRQEHNGQQKQKKVGFGAGLGHQRSVSDLGTVAGPSRPAAANASGSAPTSPLVKATIDIVSKIPEAVDSEVFDTVKHHPVRGPIEREVPAVSSAGYMDLFSPIKAGHQPVPVVAAKRQSPKRKTSVRRRPRVTSTTYQSPAGTPQKDKTEPTESTAAIQDPKASHADEERLPSAKVLNSSKPRPKDDSIQRFHTYEKYRHTPGAYIASPNTATSSSSNSASSSSKILADIKRFTDVGDPTKVRPGSLAVFAPYMQIKPWKAESDRRRRRSSASTVKAKNVGRRRSSILGEVRKVQSETQHNDGLEDDIWLSTESSSESKEPSSKPSSEETRRGRRSKQPVQGTQRHRSRGRSGRPRRTYGAKSSSEKDGAVPEPLQSAKIMAGRHEHSHSSYHSQPPSSLYPQSITTSLKPLKSPRSPNGYSPATQSVPSLANGQSLFPADYGSSYPSVLTSQLSSSSSIIISAPPSFAPSTMSPPYTSISTSALDNGGRGSTSQSYSSTSSITLRSPSEDEDEDTIIALTPNHSHIRSSIPALPLPPGYAESWAGPVEVENYLPRKGSLAAVGERIPSPRNGRARRVRVQTGDSPKRSFKGVVDDCGEVSPTRRVAREEAGASGAVGKDATVMNTDRQTPRSPFDRARERKALGETSGNNRTSPSPKASKLPQSLPQREVSRVDSVLKSRRGDCCQHCEGTQAELEALRAEVRSLRKLVKGKGRARTDESGSREEEERGVLGIWTVDGAC